MARFEIQGPDGAKYAVNAPDNASQEEVLAYARGQFGPEARPEAPKLQNKTGWGFGDSMIQGLSFNLADEMSALVKTGVDSAFDVAQGKRKLGKVISDALTLGYAEDHSMINSPMPGMPARESMYAKNLRETRESEKAYENEHPIKAIGANILGGALTGGQLAKEGVTLLNAAKPTYPSMIARGAGEGAAYGSAYGFGKGEGLEGRIDEAVKGGTIGALTGGATGALGARLAQGNASKTVPTTDMLKAQARAAYDTAKEAGLVVKDTSFAGAVDDIANSAKMAGMRAKIHPKAADALDELVNAKGTTPTLEELDIYRRVLKSAAASNEADERRVANLMIEKLDDYIGKLSADDVLAGNAELGTKALLEARGLWSRMRKGEIVETLIENAQTRASQFSGSGFENALRTEFRQLAMNPKKMRGFTGAEQAAIRKVAMGGTAENILRMIGKFAPTGIVSSALSGGAGAMMAGPAGAVALPAIGFGARQAATRMTADNARLASELIRSGGNIPAPLPLTARQMGLLGGATAGQAQQIPGLLGLPYNEAKGLFGMTQ